METSIYTELSEAINHANELRDILVNLVEDADEDATFDTTAVFIEMKLSKEPCMVRLDFSIR